MPLYDDYEIRKGIGFAVMILLVLIVFGGFILVSIFVLPNIPEFGHQRVNFLIPSAYATTVNGTANMPIPIQVHVNDPNDKLNKGTPTSALPVDAGTLTAFGAAAATIYRWRQGHTREKVGAQTDASIVDSLKKTDTGVASSLDVVHQVISQIPGVPQEAKDLIKNEADSWHEDNKAYYQNTPPATKITSDPVVAQQTATQDQTVRSDD